MSDNTLTGQNVNTANVEDSLAAERETNSLGMWVFLVSEVMLFGGLFTVYLIYRLSYPEAFAAGSQRLDVMWGTINTAVLLTSSLTMATAVYAAQTQRRKLTLLLLAATALLGLVFLGIKGYEYWQEYQEQLIPALNFTWDGAGALQVKLFFTLYFIMTGLHALHLTVGIGLVSGVPLLRFRRPYRSDPASPVEIVGLYWHFVDVVWVFLFPLLYLIAPGGGS